MKSVSFDGSPPIELWLEYCLARGLTPEVLAPLNGQLLTIDKASKILGTGIYGLKSEGAVGAYVFPITAEQFQARVLYRPRIDDIPGVVEQTKPRKQVKYFKIKDSPNVLGVPPHVND